MKRIYTYVLSSCFIINAALCGCSTPKKDQDSQMVVAAKNEAARWGWKKVETGRVRFQDGHWFVPVWRLPLTPGENATVEVSEDGRILGASGFR